MKMTAIGLNFANEKAVRLPQLSGKFERQPSHFFLFDQTGSTHKASSLCAYSLHTSVASIAI